MQQSATKLGAARPARGNPTAKAGNAPFEDRSLRSRAKPDRTCSFVIAQKRQSTKSQANQTREKTDPFTPHQTRSSLEPVPSSWVELRSKFQGLQNSTISKQVQQTALREQTTIQTQIQTNLRGQL
jgi:hypothetical protein